MAGYSHAAVSNHLLWGEPLWLDHFLSEVPVMEIVKFSWFRGPAPLSRTSHV